MRIFTKFFIALLSVMCSYSYSQEITYRINGEISNLPDGSKISMMYLIGSNIGASGKSVSKDGKFNLIHTFHPSTKTPVVLIINLDMSGQKQTISFAASPGTITIKGEDTTVKEWEIIGKDIKMIDENTSLSDLMSFSSGQAESKSEAKMYTKLNKGDIIPDGVLVDTTGVKHNISDFRDKYMLIDVWGVNCGPCMQAGDEIREIQEKYKNILNVVGITLDLGDMWKEASRKNNISWTNLSDYLGRKEGYCEKLGVPAYPYYIFVDPNGVIIDFWLGYPAKGSILKKIEPYLEIK